MPLKLNSASGSITITAQDGVGNADITLPRAGVGSVSSLSDLGVTASAADLNTTDVTTLGTVEASKVVTADASGNVQFTTDIYVGTTNSSVFNGVGGTSRVVAKGSDTATNIANNSGASITIANDDGTANNLAGLHFARADTDDDPHYAGASVVAQFLETQVTGEYPKSELAFLVSAQSNAAPSEKMRINAVGADVTGELIADSYNETYAAVTSSSNATTVDCEAGNAFSHTLTENTTFTFSNPPASGTAYSFSIEIIQDASASGFTVTWPSSVDWPAATAPTLTATASAKDVFIFTTRDGGTTFYGFTAGQALG